jgi:hypothetical protein
MTAPSAHVTPVPTLKPIRDLLTDLLGREVAVAPGEPVSAAGAGVCVAEYATDRGAVVAVAVLDLPLAAVLGGALGLIPPGGVEDAIAERELPRMLEDNLFEVVNILAGLFNVEGAPHVKLRALHGPGDRPSQEAVALAATMGRRVDIRFTVTRYGEGSGSIVLAL